MVKPVPGVMTMLSSLTELLMTLKITVKWFTTGQRFALRLFQDLILERNKYKQMVNLHTHYVTKTLRHT